MAEHPSTKRQREVLQQIHEKYGPRCNSCGYDQDVRALQIDHLDGGGSAEIRGGLGAGIAYYLRVLRDTTGKYQILWGGVDVFELRPRRGNLKLTHYLEP